MSKQVQLYWLYEKQPSKELLLERIKTRTEIVDECREFISRFDENEVLVFRLLTTYQGSLEEFLNLRRCVWPDSSFYHPGFSQQRMKIAASMACENNNTIAAPALCRSVLGLDNGSAEKNLTFGVHTVDGYSLFHGLVAKINEANGSKTEREWHTLIQDVLGHLADIKDLSQFGSPEDSTWAWQTMTPLFSLMNYGISARRFCFPQRFARRRLNPAPALMRCEKAILSWLSDLYECGIDLLHYGRNEKENFRNPSHLPEGLTIPQFHFEPKHRWSVEPLYEIRLINFRYGRLPTDWKFWWSEASDDFAGDFWCLVESDKQEAVMSVPGAWID